MYIFNNLRVFDSVESLFTVNETEIYLYTLCISQLLLSDCKCSTKQFK